MYNLNWAYYTEIGTSVKSEQKVYTVNYEHLVILDSQAYCMRKLNVRAILTIMQHRVICPKISYLIIA